MKKPLTTIKEASIEAFFKNVERVYSTEAMILCQGNSVGASASVDSQGSASAEAHITHTEQGDNGNSVSIGIEGEARRDTEGNVTAGVTATIEVHF